MASTFSELQQITHRFYYYLDERRYEDLVDLFRPEALWHRQGKILNGRAQMLAALAERPASQVIRHIITNSFLEHAAENDATLIAYLTAYRYDDGSPQGKRPLTIDGPYRVLLIKKQFVRDNGRWSIAESAGVPEFEFRARA